MLEHVRGALQELLHCHPQVSLHHEESLRELGEADGALRALMEYAADDHIRLRDLLTKIEAANRELEVIKERVARLEAREERWGGGFA